LYKIINNCDVESIPLKRGDLYILLDCFQIKVK
jgi:hypothetical protein